MSVIVRSLCGIVLSHSNFKFSVLTTSGNQLDTSDQHIQHYAMKRELFDVYTPFYPDSQAERILNESQKYSKSDHSVTARETSAQRKRKKKKPPVISNEERKISELLEKVFPELIMQVKDNDFFVTPSSKQFLEVHNNNKASRLTALSVGCGDLFQELCSQETMETMKMEESKAVMLYRTSKCLTYPSTSFIHNIVENAGNFGIQVALEGHSFFIPSRSRFLMSSFSTLVTHLYGLLSVPDGYDLIVMDPPWGNKSVKRKKTYGIFDETELCSFPLQSLCKSGALVCVWVTNNDRMLAYLKDVVFPTWNVRWLSDWFWLKVTKCGEPICDIHSSHKKPYERLVIGRFEDPNHTSCGVPKDFQQSHLATKNDEDACEAREKPTSTSESQDGEDSFIREDYVLVTVPCSLHSKKPPLSEAMSPYLPPEPKCLEMFARNLMPGWTSWGNEVLRHQHKDYHELVT